MHKMIFHYIQKNSAFLTLWVSVGEYIDLVYKANCAYICRHTFFLGFFVVTAVHQGLSNNCLCVRPENRSKTTSASTSTIFICFYWRNNKENWRREEQQKSCYIFHTALGLKWDCVNLGKRAGNTARTNVRATLSANSLTCVLKLLSFTCGSVFKIFLLSETCWALFVLWSWQKDVVASKIPW